MNLIQVIHRRWAAAEALNAVLPAAQVFTGMGTDPTVPSAVICKRSDRPLESFSNGSGTDLVVVRIEVFCESYDLGAAAIHEIKTAFDRTAFDLDDGDRVLLMRRSNDFENQAAAGTWQMVIDFECTVELAAGV